MSTPTSSSSPTWLITGTSSGLGLSLSQHILQKGHNLISISRHPDPDPSLTSLSGSYTGHNNTSPTTNTTPKGILHHIQIDLSNPDSSSITKTITTFLDTHPNLTPNVLVNNAAVTTFSPLETTSPTDLVHVMTTNFFSPVYIIQAVLPYMRRPSPASATETQTQEKVIVNISSTQGLCPDPSELSYDASKHALEAMSGVLAAETAVFGVRVMVVNLGSLRTGFARGGERSGVGGATAGQQERWQDERADSSDPYEDPDHPVARRIAGVKKLVDFPGLARGDPNKTAAVLFDAVMKTKGSVVDGVLEAQRQKTLSEAEGSGIGKVERLVLGSDAQPKIERVLERLRRDVEGCRVVSSLVEADG